MLTVYDQFSRFDSAQGPSIAGGINISEISWLDSSKIGGSAGQINDFNRIDSNKFGSFAGANDYGRIDSTKLGSSNAVSSANEFGNAKNISGLLNMKTPSELQS